MRTNITRSWFETILDYKPRILHPKIEEFLCLVYKLSVTNTNRSTIETAVKNGVKNIQTAGYNGARAVDCKYESLNDLNFC